MTNVSIAWLAGIGRYTVPDGAIIETEVILAEDGSTIAPGEGATPKRRGRPKKNPVDKTE